MKQFTDLLEDWLYAREELKEVHDNYEGHSFGYYHERDIKREHEARQALNKTFDELRGQV
jgi:uncharacterized heparinase superfamily protein